MARALALAPELLARARPVADAAGLERLRDRFAVHPGQHQRLAAVMLLRHRGDETVAVEAQSRQRRRCGLGRGVGVRHGACSRPIRAGILYQLRQRSTLSLTGLTKARFSARARRYSALSR